MVQDKDTVRDVQTIYAARFGEFEHERDRVWQVLARYFQQWVKSTDTVLDVGAGYCEFINNIQAKQKFALDVNPSARLRASRGVNVLLQDVCGLWPLQSESVDVVFSSNFFEHLHAKEELSHCLAEAYRILRRGGMCIVMGPNIRFCSDVYWDFFDHHIPLSDRSIAEVLELSGFDNELVIPRFLPFTMSGRRPPPPVFVRLYLSMPLFWRILGKQFLILARKGEHKSKEHRICNSTN